MTTPPDNPPNGLPAVSGAGGAAAALARIRGEVHGLLDTLWAAGRPEELMDAVTEAESLKSTIEALELGIVRELEVTGAVKPCGWASTQDFVTAVAGGHKGTGPATVRLARAVDRPLMATVGEALAEGWLSVAKAQVIERGIDTLPGDPDLRARAVQVLLEHAKALDATDLRKLTHRLISTVDPDGEERRAERDLEREDRAAHLDRELAIGFDPAGGCRIRGRCSAEDGAKLRATLLPLAKPHPHADGPICDPDTCDVPGCGHDGRDPRDHGARMLDALIGLCDSAAACEVLPESHGTSPRVSVTIDFEDLKAETGFGSTETGEDLYAAAVRRMACDAHIIPIILGAGSEVLDVGRHQRLVTAALWKALVARDKPRDQHCRFPNCTRPPVMCHAHHILHWCNGGETSLGNTILLCGHHHRLVHSGPWRITPTGPAIFRFDQPPGTRRTRTTGREPPDETSTEL